MGQKINPKGFRVGISKDWDSRWFADKFNYPKLVKEDKMIREYLMERFATAGIKKIEIERSPNEVNITIKVSRPGVVIGRGGAGVTEAQEKIKEFTDSKSSLTAEQIKDPELHAQLVADYISRQIKRRIHYRRVVSSAVQSAMDKGAKGIKIQVSGLLSGGNSISRRESTSMGSVPTQTLRADIDYAQVHCKMLYGTIGIKVWIYKGEKEI